MGKVATASTVLLTAATPRPGRLGFEFARGQKDFIMPSVDYRAHFQGRLDCPAPLLALAPMQNVTDLPFLRLISTFGGADIYFTEYFRVHVTSTLDKYILRSIL